MLTEPPKAVTLFYCYAREDEWLLNELEKHLAPLQRQGYLTGWHNRQIEAGADWQQEIESHLSAANLILVLLSPDFVHSDACDEEMRRAMELHHTGQARVIPILLRPVLWESTPLADLESLPEHGQPITSWPNQDQAFRQIAFHLANVVSKQLNLPSLQTQDWQALVSSSPAATSFVSSQQLNNDPSFVPRNPYRGLHAFTVENAADFFGRDRLIAELLQAFQKVVSPSQNGSARLLSVVGPSGCGKSSVVMAGLFPALKQGKVPGSEHWIYLEPIVPGQHPLEELARTLSYQFPQRSLASLREDLAAPNARGLYLLLKALLKSNSTVIFLYIDQFEELFAQTLEKEEQIQFINLLLTVLTEPDGTLALTISLRADFYDRPMLQVPQLFRLMQAAQVSVLPLDQQDLRDVIKKPAALPDVRLRFEDDLAGELLAEMRGQSGALPLLQFTLDRLFQTRRGQFLTLEAYHAMGGVQGALAQHAEATYATLLTEEHRALTRALFLCLVEVGEIEQNPTRRRVVLGELALDNTNQARLLQEVAARFTIARLLTTTSLESKAIVEVSHEAIIRGWTRLADWLRNARDDLYLQRRLREDAATWLRQGRSSVRLYRDEQLSEALAWRQRSLLSHDEETFLLASVQEDEHQQALTKQKEAQQQQLYRRRVVLVGLGGLMLATVAATIGARALSSTKIVSVRPSPSLILPYIYTGHTGDVASVAWSPDGKRLASASGDMTVRVWDASSGQTLLTYTGHAGTVESVAWSPDGKRLASGGADGRVRIWDASNGQSLLTCKGQTSTVVSVAWSPDGKRLASASDDKTVRIWDASSGQTLLTYTGHTNRVSSVSWSPDGQRLASASDDETVRIWDASNGQILLTYTGHTGAVVSVAWSPDGQRLASASDDKAMRIWDANNGQSLLICKGHADYVGSVAWSPDGKRLASGGGDRTVRIWDASNGQILLTYTGHTNYVGSVAWSPDGKRLASASGDETVRIWDASSGQTLLTYTGNTNYVGSVAWSPDGKRLASSGTDTTVHIWDASSGQTLLICKGHTSTVVSVAWSPDGKRLASASDDTTVRIWDASSGQTLLTCTGHTGTVKSVAWFPDGQRLASASVDKTVRIWDASSGQSLLTCTGHTGGVSSVAWSSDGQRLASASGDKTVRIWDASNGQSLLICKGHTDTVFGVAWSPNGKCFASAGGGDKTVRIWDANNGQSLLTYTGHTGNVYSVVWSPDDELLASASGDETVQVLLWL